MAAFTQVSGMQVPPFDSPSEFERVVPAGDVGWWGVENAAVKLANEYILKLFWVLGAGIGTSTKTSVHT
ncbi:MAG: hypothetical protein Q9188_004007 [Gyalolechia gomerana]